MRSLDPHRMAIVEDAPVELRPLPAAPAEDLPDVGPGTAVRVVRPSVLRPGEPVLVQGTSSGDNVDASLITEGRVDPFVGSTGPLT